MILNWTSLSDNTSSRAPHYSPGLDSNGITSGNNEREGKHSHALEHASNLLCFRGIVSSEELSEVHVNNSSNSHFENELYFGYNEDFLI